MEALTEAEAPQRPRRARRQRNTLRIVVPAVIVLILLGCAAWLGVRAYLAQGELRTAQALGHDFVSAVSSEKTDEAQRLSQELKGHVDSARDYVGDPVWRAAGVLPIVGKNFSAATQLTRTLSDVVDGAVVPVARVAADLSPANLRPVNGTLNLDAVDRARPVVDGADTELGRAHEEVSTLPRGFGMLPQLESGMDQLGGMIEKAHEQSSVAKQALSVLPALLGAQGPRNYLLLFQNNAELRSTGGIPGAIALIHVEKGKIALTEHTAAKDFPEFPEPVLPLAPQVHGLYGDIAGRYMQDVNLTPQFPLAASLASEMWKRQMHTDVDGVIALDPIVLSHVLQATGPVSLPSGESLSSANAVKMLLSDVYATYRNISQKDEYFSLAASAVFAKVSTGEFNSTAMLAALTQSANENRLLMWSAHTEEQSLFTAIGRDGGLPSTLPSAPELGVYLNDAVGSKMSYYLDVSYRVGGVTCRADGRPSWEVEVTLKNNAPPDAAKSLPEYVTGGGVFGVRPGIIKTQVNVYAIPESVYLDAQRNGTHLDVHTDMDTGYSVAQTYSMLAPGQSETIRMRFLGPSGTAQAPRLISTPTVNAMTTASLPLSCGVEIG